MSDGPMIGIDGVLAHITIYEITNTISLSILGSYEDMHAEVPGGLVGESVDVGIGVPLGVLGVAANVCVGVLLRVMGVADGPVSLCASSGC